MKKAELLGLGISEEQIRAIQDIHGRDMVRLRAKILREIARPGACKIREAISAMLPMIETETSLLSILKSVNFLYYSEIRDTEAKTPQEDDPPKEGESE